MVWAFRAAVILLLAATLTVQVKILRKIPDPLPSIATLQTATTPQAKKDVLMRRPLVTVNGSVEVEGTVDVDIQNTPVEVEIVR